jgi:antitoxin component YwqK of YwqJK toxin-antitoxin module
MFFSNGKVEFSGKMKNGKREGWGKIYHSNGQIFYMGEFKVNEPNTK